MFKRLDHIGVGTADAERFLDFYVGILGFEVREQWASKPGGGSSQVAGLANLALGGGAVIEMFSISRTRPIPPTTGRRSGRACGTCASRSRISTRRWSTSPAKGIEIHRAHPSNPACWIEDPDGNMLVIFPSFVYENYKKMAGEAPESDESE